MGLYPRCAVPPTASVIQKHSPSPVVVYHATGFFPKEVMITWRKDGEDVNEDVELRETLPNQDGSFQKRSILKVPAEELQKHTYTCVIQHSSLEEELVLNVSERQILRVQSNGECGKEVKKRVQAGWNGWRKVSGVLCDRKISARIKEKVYRTVVRPAMLYGLETVSLRKRQESELEYNEVKENEKKTITAPNTAFSMEHNRRH
ncbi:hypothetical protein QTP86_001546 [Hemibagrus guttatus]|nr:hypothetical protein QTP86_001546 [Hemibagrus guttatus]